MSKMRIPQYKETNPRFVKSHKYYYAYAKNEDSSVYRDEFIFR